MRSHMLVMLTMAIGFGTSGCIGKVLIDGQIQGTRQAAPSADTVGDFDVARGAVLSGIATFEGLHRLAPDNEDGLYLLANTWTGYGSGFAEDDMQVAQDQGNDEAADLARKRARGAYDRAVFYGLQLLGQTADGFNEAKGSQQSLEAWLNKNFTSKDDAANLRRAGLPWVLRVGLMASDDDEGPAFVAELYVGIAILERAAAIDPAGEHYLAPMALAGYHARASMAELDQAKEMFDSTMAKTQGKTLLIPLTYALHYACTKGDATLYQSLLNRVVNAQDPDPDQRLTNAIAKRQAKRWLGKHRAKDMCGIDVGGSSSSNMQESGPAPAAVAAPAPAPEPVAPVETKPAKPAKERHKAAKPAASPTH